jgi:hypothetical protein
MLGDQYFIGILHTDCICFKFLLSDFSPKVVCTECLPDPELPLLYFRNVGYSGLIYVVLTHLNLR